MNADGSESGKTLGFYFRRFALVAFLLMVSRGAVGLATSANRLAGILVLVLFSVITVWALLALDSHNAW